MNFPFSPPERGETVDPTKQPACYNGKEKNKI